MVELQAEDKSYLLKTPLHGVYIPAALLAVGVGILRFDWMPYGIAAALLLAALKFHRGKSRLALDANEYRKYEVESIVPVTKSFQLIRVNLRKSNDSLGLAVGQFIEVKAESTSGELVQPFAPISADDNVGYFDLLVNPAENAVSSYLCGLKEHQLIDIRGPVGKFSYVANRFDELGMIADSTRIAPLLQVIDSIIKTPEDVTKVSLIYISSSVEDIALKDDLDELAAGYPHFRVYYLVNKMPLDRDKWTGGIGDITKETMKKYLPLPSAKMQLLISTSPPTSAKLRRFTEELGYERTKAISEPDDQVFIF